MNTITIVHTYYNDVEFLKQAIEHWNTFTTPVSIILIDDARLFTGKDDYPSIKQIERKVKLYKIASKVIVSNDVIQIIPNKK